MANDDYRFLQSGQVGQDSFGFETPEGALSRVRARFADRRAEFFGSNAAADHGRRVGQAFADIFGQSVRRALDTSVARKAEQERLIASGTDPKEARERAKAAISPEFAEVRRAKQMQGFAAESRSYADNLMDEGMPAASAQAVAMFQMARKLESAGFGVEANKMRINASEMLQAQEKRENERAQLLASTSNTQANTVNTTTRLRSDDDTFVRFNKDGVVDDWQSVAVTDPERREELRQLGYIRAGQSLSFGLDKTSLSNNAPPPDGVRTEINAQLDMLNGLDILRAVDHRTGIVKGPLTGWGVKLGLVDDNEIVNAKAVVDKMLADIQSTIDGIPSDYDAALFQKQVPDPFKAQTQALYNARIDLLEGNIRKALELTVAYYNGTNKELTPQMKYMMNRFGMSKDGIDAMSEEEFIAAKKAHEADMMAEIDVMQERESRGEQAMPSTREELLRKMSIERERSSGRITTTPR